MSDIYIGSASYRTRCKLSIFDSKTKEIVTFKNKKNNYCLAYFLDGINNTLRKIGKDSFTRTILKNELNLFSFYLGGIKAEMKYYVDPPNYKSILSRLKNKEELNFVIAAYVRLPLLALDPDPIVAKFIKKNPRNLFSESRLSKNKDNLVVNVPGFIAHHPALVWTAGALLREAISSYLGVDDFGWRKGEDIPVETKFFRALKNSFDKDTLKSVINSYNHEDAYKLWKYSLKPILRDIARDGDSIRNVWYDCETDYYNEGVMTYNNNGYLQYKKVNSINYINRLIKAGGWAALGENLYKNWALDVPKDDFYEHASTVPALEQMVYYNKRFTYDSKLSPVKNFMKKIKK